MPIQRVTGAVISKSYKASEVDFQLGARYEDDMGRVYQYVQYETLGAAEGVQGQMGVAPDSAYGTGLATCDSNHADAVPAIPMGQFQAQLDDGECGFTQVKGWNRLALPTGAAVSQGDELVASSAAKGVVITKAAHVTSVGAARAASSGNSLAAGTVMLMID
ncbi:MAG: hypothetical protein ACXAEN_22160 [Candidatus Thorarchaeota archaeon]|jgi:hypothetical protein